MCFCYIKRANKNMLVVHAMHHQKLLQPVHPVTFVSFWRWFRCINYERRENRLLASWGIFWIVWNINLLFLRVWWITKYLKNWGERFISNYTQYLLVWKVIFSCRVFVFLLKCEHYTYIQKDFCILNIWQRTGTVIIIQQEGCWQAAVCLWTVVRSIKSSFAVIHADA